MRELSKEEAIKLHKEMWNYIKDNMDVDEPMVRYNLKKMFLSKIGLSESAVKSRCFLCEYAKQQYKLRNDYFGICGEFCKCCPAVWGTEGLAEHSFCEVDSATNVTDWRYSPIDDIINIKIKED